ncbi:hypothetical protein G9A89_019249 [Geosiphon pyriformis]|nr:hypothetical protein G9A89_019249 [Geosiphon pyriformis]
MFSSSNQSLRLHQWSSGTGYTQNLSSQNYLSLLVTLEDTTSHNLEIKQKQPLTNNILPATITKDKLLTAIFFFELEEPVEMPLFSRDNKGKRKKEDTVEEDTTTEEITSGWKKFYSYEPLKQSPYIPLKYQDCGKKLSSMGA